MSAQNINWKRKISENQQFRSTWEVEIDGETFIAKKIETDDQKKLEALVKRLTRQIKFSESLNEDEQKKICLYENKYEGDGYVAFFRKYCPGASLAELISRKRYSLTEAVNLVLEISRIVRIAHEHHIYHGDLKPANIIVNDEGEATIIDWDTMTINDSIRKELVGDVTEEGVCGTPQYMPPEQFQGETIGPQNDVYAMGVILYQLLCGETPFVNVGMTPTQMAIYKQKHDPKSILVEHSELGIPSDLGHLIEESIKSDLNQRIQSIDIFIQRLETIGKISASKESIATVSSSPAASTNSDYVPARVKGKEYKLVLIGHTGSGKTVLAAGLYSTQDKDFAVDDPGSKTETGIHAINTKTIIEEGHWPAATSVGEITKLRFKLNYKGKQECIAFDEYAGERLEMDDFDNEIIKNPDGAFILLNPGGQQWHTPHDKNIMMSDLKHYIEVLSRKANNPPIALVITASDRLESDLKDFAPKFKKYVEELENNLISKNCVYQVFYVSVSGILENQAQPHLNPQHIKDPFIWLLKNFTARAWKRRIKTIVSIAALFVIALLVAFFGEYIREYSKVSSLKKSYSSIEKEFNEKGTKESNDYLLYRKNLIDLRNKYCIQQHFSNNGRTAECTLSCKPIFFLTTIGIRGNEKKFNEQLIVLEKMIDKTNADYYSRRLKDVSKNLTENNISLANDIQKWIPLHDDIQAYRSELIGKAKELPLTFERNKNSDLLAKLQKVCHDEETVFPSKLEEEYQAWQSMNSVLSEEERGAAIDQMQTEYRTAKIACEKNMARALISKFERVKDSIPDDLETDYNNWMNTSSYMSEADRNTAVTHVQSAYRIARITCERNMAETIIARLKNVVESIPEDLETEYKNWMSISSYMSTEERNVAVAQMKEEYRKAKVACENRMIEKILSKLRNVSDAIPSDIETDYQTWMNMDSYMSGEERAIAKTRINEEFLAARKRVFNHAVSLIEGAINSNRIDSVNSLAKLVDDYMKSRNSVYSDATELGFIDRIYSLDRSIWNITNRFIQDRHSKELNSQNDSDEYNRPDYGDELKRKVTLLYPSDVKDQFDRQIDANIESEYQQWLNYKYQEAYNISQSINNSAINEALNLFDRFYFKHENNPYCTNVATTLKTKVDRDLEQMISNFNYTYSQSYNTLNLTCSKIRKTFSAATKCNATAQAGPGTTFNAGAADLQSNWMRKFADGFISMMDQSNHNVFINRIEVRSTFSKGAYIKTLSYSVGSNDPTVHFDLSGNSSAQDDAVFKDTWSDLKEFSSIDATCKPWQQFTLISYICEDIKALSLGGFWRAGIDRDMGDKSISFTPGVSAYKTGSESTSWSNDRGEVFIVVHYELNYKTVKQLFREAKQ